MKSGAAGKGRFRGKEFLLLLGGILSLSVLSYLLVFAPKLAAVRQLRGEAEKSNEELSRALSAWQEIVHSSRGDIARLERLAATWDARVPEEPETERLMEEFVREAARHHLRSLRIEIPEDKGAVPTGTVSGPGQAGPEKKAMEEIPLKVTFSSTYRDMADFLEAIPRMKRLASVRSLKIRRHEGRMETEILLKAFYRRGA